MTSVDVVVYGATAGGVTAAVAAARHGASVILLEPGWHVGGMVSGGLGYTDIGDRRALGGMAAEFEQAVADNYGVAPGFYAGPEPHVAEEIFLRWLELAGVDVRLGSALSTVDVVDGLIRSVGEFGGGVFVDASYEGDLLAAAGVPYRIGRESPATFGETHAGRREYTPGKHNFPPFVSPFYDGTDALLPLIRRRPAAPVGDGDGGVMSYGYRVCLSRAPDRIPFDRRDGYEPAEFELARRLFRHTDDVPVIGLVPNLPNDKCDGNSVGPLSLNLLDGTNWAYPDAVEDERATIRDRHRNYTRDLLYFLTHDSAVPKRVKRQFAGWGFAADEFADGAGIPHQLYVREARRAVGEYTLTENDLLPTPRPQYDAVAMGSYHIDIREVQRTWRWIYEHPDPLATVFNEGYLSVPVRPYQIPYRCIVPRFGECTNLLFPVCLSASHVAFASVRMEPQYEMLGQAAGVAAALASTGNRPVQRVDVGILQEKLADSGAVLDL